MATSIFLLVMLLSLFSLTLCHEEVGEKNTLWSSLTPLQLAAMEGRADDVENILLQKKESSNIVTGMSPLHWAALRGHTPVIRVLLRFGTDIHSLDNQKNTALHMAAISGSPDTVQELILAKVDLNARNRNNKTALHFAVSKQDFEVVKKLLRFGALTNITDQEGRSPLDLATEANNLMIMALLQASGAVEIKCGKTSTTPAATVATTTTKPPKIRLPKATRRPELRRLTEKEMRLHEAAKNLQDIIIADLCAEGIDPNIADIQNNGYTALHLAAAVHGRVALLTLARCSANLNVKDFDGNTPLHIAVIKDYSWTADFLLMLGANPNILNNKGQSPKDLVTPGKKSFFQDTFNPERMKWISDIRPLSDGEQNLLDLMKNGRYFTLADSCKEGVDVRVKDVNQNQYTMLHYAVSFKHSIPCTIQMLIRCGADINARDADGNTPLHLAVLGKFYEAQKVLLLNGADPYIANGAGMTAYQLLKEASPEAIDARLQWYMNSMPL